MKKVIKILLLMLSFIIIFSFITTKCTNAYIDTESFNPWDIQKEGVDGDTVTTYTNRILGSLSVFGIVASVISLFIVGFKFITAGATEKAEYQKHLLPIVLGILLMVFLTSILGVLSSFGESINDGRTQKQIVVANSHFIGSIKP
ncbi:MAG: hypothetical protein J6K42_01330 [Clostridia bacterium]|nr:hypothetical protein [Clostridia bacterium]